MNLSIEKLRRHLRDYDHRFQPTAEQEMIENTMRAVIDVYERLVRLENRLEVKKVPGL